MASFWTAACYNWGLYQSYQFIYSRALLTTIEWLSWTRIYSFSNWSRKGKHNLSRLWFTVHGHSLIHVLVQENELLTVNVSSLEIFSTSIDDMMVDIRHNIIFFFINNQKKIINFSILKKVVICFTITKSLEF